MSEPKPGWDEVMVQIGAKQERERLMDLLDAESVTHQERGQIVIRQWARAWIREQGLSAD